MVKAGFYTVNIGLYMGLLFQIEVNFLQVKVGLEIFFPKDMHTNDGQLMVLAIKFDF